MRINKFLAQCGFGSRREVESLILEGRVKGKEGIITQLSYQVSEKEIIRVGSKVAHLPEVHKYYAFHKPKAVLCTRHDPEGRPTVYDLLPSSMKNLHLVGRLDYHSRGLLLLTTHGDLTQKLLRPEYGIEREYYVRTKPSFPQRRLAEVRKGVQDERGNLLKPKEVLWYPGFLRFILTEGKNREIRKIIEAFEEFEVKDLLRVRYGAVNLGELEEGEWRPLFASERNSLLSVHLPIK